MKNVTLISTYPNIYANGLRTLSACLKVKGFNTKIIFVPNPSGRLYEARVLRGVIDFSVGSDLIGISLMTNFFKNSIQITQELKKNLTIPIVWGGVHPTVNPLECLDYVDMICLGEGEETLMELVTKISRSEDCYNILGMWFKKKGKIIDNQLRPLIQNLDKIPYQDFDCDSHYMVSERYTGKMNEDFLKVEMKGHYVVTATRGCPFGCSYCLNNMLNKMYPNQKWVRKRSISNIIGELETIKNKFSFIDRFQFDDDAFMMYSKEELVDFAKEYKKLIKLPLHITGVAPSTVNKEKLAILVEAGLKHVRMGIQTANEPTKKLYKRYDSNQQVEKAVSVIDYFKDQIRSIEYDIILDNPWETDTGLVETLMFLARLPTPYILALYSLTFFPGTELYGKAKREGLIGNDSNDLYSKNYSYCKETYLNRLFFLLKQYALHGPGINPWVMFLLTNNKLRKLRVSSIIYWILKLLGVSIPIIFVPKILVTKGLRSVYRGDFSRITSFIKKELLLVLMIPRKLFKS